MKREKVVTSEEFDRKFDAGKGVMKYMDLSTAVFRANVDFPDWAVKALDQEATRIGVTRQSLIKMWIIERLDTIRDLRKSPRK